MPRPAATPNRRMTLGAIPSTTKHNRRMSMTEGEAPPSGSKPSRRPPKARLSMIPRLGRENAVPMSPRVTAPTASSRRRSVGGVDPDRRRSLIPPAAPPAKVDPRPINDKVFQQQSIRRLMQFLEETGYPYPLSHKSLARPSAKDFNNIVTFMLRLVDPDFQKGGMKLEDEVCINFKNIGYPFTISKTSLVAAGSPHTWPSLLAALSWLMEHLQCAAADETPDYLYMDAPFESLEELESRTDRAFFQFLDQAYIAYMTADAERLNGLEHDLANRFLADDKVLVSEVDRITDLNATVVERIQLLKQEMEDFPSYAQKREAYATDLEQFHDLIRRMDDHKAALAKKVEERTAELEATNEKLDKMTQHIEDLKQTIATQQLSTTDLRKMESEGKGVAEAMDRLAVVKEERRRALTEAEEALIRFANDFEAEITSYNEVLSQVIEFSELRALSNLKVALKKDTLGASPREMLGGDLDKDVRPLIERSMQNITDKTTHVKDEYQDALDRLERCKEAVQDVMAKKQIIEDKIAKCEETLKQDHESHEAKLSVRRREIEAMENKVTSLRDPIALEEQMAAYERQCAELEALYARHQEENIAKKRAVLEEIETACRLMAEHEEHFQRKLDELDQYSERKRSATGTVSLPPNVHLDD